ncbi:MAG: wax ester/triacylglycerol synthase family O-acyltransferase [Myxococcales bacterium]|nr:wax ester/triacylglycerol synthase family O-acyltransferase [Myxococcales bacterium]
MDRMSPQDASFLHVENDVNHMHIASVGIFEGPAPAQSEIVQMVAAKLHLVPRYRQVVRFVPLELERPVWVDDSHFNIGYHVRHTALPAPGGEDQLRALVGRVMAQQLDRAKPLWEMWIVEGLEEGCWALLSKTHHCMVDGVSATDLLTVIMDAEPDTRHEEPVPWEPEPWPTDAELLTQALRERLFSPREIVRGLRSAARAPGRVLDSARALVSGSRSLARVATGNDVGLNGPIGPHRRWDWARTTLGEVKQVRRAFGGTVNDVVLAVISKGFRELLLSRGLSVEDKVVRTLVPVSVRREGERGIYNNRVSAMFAELPVGIEDPLKRLDAVRVQMEHLKEKKQAVAAEVLTSLSGFAPAVLLALGGRVFVSAVEARRRCVPVEGRNEDNLWI